MESIKIVKSKHWWIGEIRSHFITVASIFVSFVALDGYELLFALYDGQWEVVTKDAVFFLLIRSATKTALTLLFPTLFPPTQAKANP